MSRLERRLRFEPDGTIVALSGKVEFGQGLRASYPRIVAEEMRVDPARVRVVLGDTDLAPWDMGTFGSMSVEIDGADLRRAAAFARELLVARAAARFGVAPGRVGVEDGVASCDGRSARYEELAAEAPMVGDVPDDFPVAPRSLEDTAVTPDAVAMVTGRVEFAGDVRLPGMLHGAAVHAPTHGARLVSIERASAEAMPGVVAVVVSGDFAGVVAETHGRALAARRALAPKWEPRAPKDGAERVTMRDDAGHDEALAGAARRVARRYFVPHAASAPIGPSVGVVDVRDGEALVFGTTQRPFALRDDVAEIAGLASERVHFRPRAMSGGYGRHSSGDAALEAARFSAAVRRPVRVQWTREDEFLGAPNRPETTVDLEAGLDANGEVVAWRFAAATNPYSYGVPSRLRRPGGWTPAQMIANMCGRGALAPYEVGRARVEVNVSHAKIRTGAMRSLGAFPNVLAIESFVDELAHEMGEDPIAWRLRRTSDARLRRVLEVVRDRSGWAPGRRGFGAACAVYRNTYVAEVVEVSIGAGVRLERAWCAIDAGHVVHPDGARNQVEGAVQMAASWTLLEALVHRDGAIVARNLDDYRIARCTDAPGAIDVVFVGDDAAPSAGMGEPPAVPIGAAIANAVFSATGERVRALPILTAALSRSTTLA
jgi:nicotinate dehydrogenase subunit B